MLTTRHADKCLMMHIGHQGTDWLTTSNWLIVNSHLMWPHYSCLSKQTIYEETKLVHTPGTNYFYTDMDSPNKSSANKTRWINAWLEHGISLFGGDWSNRNQHSKNRPPGHLSLINWNEAVISHSNVQVANSSVLRVDVSINVKTDATNQHRTS